jgi:hypothetical protein
VTAGDGKKKRAKGDTHPLTEEEVVSVVRDNPNMIIQQLLQEFKVG